MPLARSDIAKAEAIYRNKQNRTASAFVADVHNAVVTLGLDLPECAADRSEFASRCGYAAVPAAMKGFLPNADLRI